MPYIEVRIDIDDTDSAARIDALKHPTTGSECNFVSSTDDYREVSQAYKALNKR
jgi:hypothetical protein